MVAPRVIAAALLAALASPANAQSRSQPSAPPKSELMTCDELLRLRSDQRRWNQITQTRAVTDLGWSFHVRRTAAIDAAEKETASATVSSLEVAADVRHGIGAVVVPRNTLAVPYGVLPMRFAYRWISAKPPLASPWPGRCSDEETKTAEIGKDAVIPHFFNRPAETDNGYTLVGYDDRKTVLFTAEFTVSPRQAGTPRSASNSTRPVQPIDQQRQQAAPTPSATDENTAALGAAYRRVVLIERCAALGAYGLPRSRVREMMSRMEKTAETLKIDTAAVRRKAQQDSKSSTEMFDMFEALGAMNYEQRNTLSQFCAVANTEFLDASKHFAGLEQAAGQ